MKLWKRNLEMCWRVLLRSLSLLCRRICVRKWWKILFFSYLIVGGLMNLVNINKWYVYKLRIVDVFGKKKLIY